MPQTATLDQGEEQTFSALSFDTSGRSVEVPLRWTASGGSLWTNGTHGVYTAGSTPGVYAVTATSDLWGVVGSAAIVVGTLPVASVTVTPAAVQLDPGATAQLTAATLDDAGRPLTGRSVSWSSSEPAVAEVSATGLVTAVTQGAAIITATSEGRSGTAAVTVLAPPVPPPGTVSDLAASSPTDTSVTLAFTEVSSGAGPPASYDVRYAVAPIAWGSASAVTRGTCAPPVRGSAIGVRLACTVLGLAPATTYEFQVVAYRGALNVDAVFGGLSNVARATTTGAAPAVGECASARAEWIWCDDFEEDRLGRYFEYEDAEGNFVRSAGVGVGGSMGMRARWATVGQSGAGGLHLAFGKTPQTYFRPVDAGTAQYREVYWRMYVRHQPGWVGGGADKLSRAMIFASSTTWAQAMIAHVWSGSVPQENYLALDPASGTDASGTLVTTGYNDFAHLRWLGAARSATPIFDAAHVGQWYCVEARVKLNDAGQANGVFELWINGALEAQRTGLNWVGAYNAYGINAVFFESYWNAGTPVPQERYFDHLVVSTQPIGCLS